MKRRIRAAILAVLAASVGLVAQANPAHARPDCDVPDPPPICDGAGSHDPEGDLTGATRVPAGVSVTGWATDPDGGRVQVDISIGGTKVGTVTAGSGGSFSGTVPARPGSTVCARALSNGAGSSKLIGCVNLAVAVDPVGAVDRIERVGTDLVLHGWAIDGDTTDAIWLHVYQDGVFATAAPADRALSAPPAGYPGYGTGHGFAVTVPERPGDGEHNVCVYAINVGAGTVNTELGCRTYTVRHDPTGALDEVTRTGNTLRVRGWSADPDEPQTPTEVHIYDSGVFVRSVTANGHRPDLPGEYGPTHGYDVTDLPANMTPGPHTVCAYAINRSHGVHNTQLGCRNYAVPAPVAAPTINPFGEWDIYSNEIHVSWTDNSTSEDGYRVERSVAGGPWAEISRRTDAFRSLTDRNLTPNTRHCYRVIAFNELTEAAAEVCATTKQPPLPQPTGLTVVGRTDTTLTVRWTDNAEGEDHYLLGWGRPTDQILPRIISIPANPGTGEMTYTVTGLDSSTDYRVAVSPRKAGHDTAPPLDTTAWTTGGPIVDGFTSSVGAVQACTPTEVTLNWKTTGATRVVVKRGTTTLADRTQSGPGVWEGSVSGGSHDGNVLYTLTAYAADGRTATANVPVYRSTPYPLVKSIEFNNTGWYRLEAWYYDLYDNKIQKIGDVASGGKINITPGHCQVRRIKVIDPNTGRVAFMPGSQLVLGHNEGGVSQVAAG
ncbi:fibronectin type III domain-containing protein [Polymorphospora rubra]|uniref:fibronectin type III domain-containing protein n=1 Tax=Polymorphospora rubra TaxID=338584 RepID=UPI0033EB230F